MVSIYELKLGAEKLEILKVLSAEIEKAITSIGKIDNSRLNAIYNDILEKANQVLQDKNFVQELKDKVDVAHKDISEKAASINQKFEQQQALQQSLQKLKAEIEALLKSGLIDDNAERTTTTYSSKKIGDLLKLKTDKADFDDLKNTVGNKLDKTETAADSAKLGGSPASDYALKTEINTLETNLANKLGKNDQASDSAKLGGLAADKYAKKDDIPAAPQAATETEAGIVKLKNSITGSLSDTAVSEKAAKEYIDKNASIGIGQTWQVVTSERQYGVIYTNTTRRPIMVYIRTASGSGVIVSLEVDGIEIANGGYATGSGSDGINTIVPPNATYKLTGNGTGFGKWLELR